MLNVRRDHRRRHLHLRPQSVRHYSIRGFRDSSVLVIEDVAEMQAWLDNRRHLNDVERLILAIGIGHGVGTMTFGELKRAGLAAIAEAGDIKAAIKVLERARARGHKETTN